MYCAPPCLYAIAAASIRTRSTFKPGDLVAMAWSDAALPFQHGPCMYALSSSAIRNITAEYNPALIAGLAWSMSPIGFPNRPAIYAISAAAIRRITEYAACDILKTAWAIAAREVCDQPLLDSIAAAAIPKLSDGQSRLRMLQPQLLATLEAAGHTGLHCLAEPKRRHVLPKHQVLPLRPNMVALD
eukprot:NODE_15435_length_1050_cov_4.211268.p1 GENE.NODE_15435_length_1050_cov_4.211268~~NODE_15435_length_1050_cov_4.211268.p1  ORF type:complete len:186 (+),score=5.25 NODE_15435_length_1050_cov_4.211268:306-863(+)